MAEGSNTVELVRRKFSRRSILKAAAGMAGIAGLTAVAKETSVIDKIANMRMPGDPKDLDFPEPNAQPQETKLLHFGNRNITAEIFRPEEINIPNISHYPDGHSSFIKTQDEIMMWIAGGPSGYILRGKDFNNIRAHPRESIKASGKEDFDRDYASPGSVIPSKNPGDFLMFYHGESHPVINADGTRASFPFNAGIGLAVSKNVDWDSEKVWERKGQIIKGKNYQPAVDRVYGAGEPCAIIKDGYIYLYYVDWNGQNPDSIHLTRASIESNGMPGSWEKFNNGEFQNTGMDGPSTPVIPAEAGNYSAIPSISWNSFLNKFLAVFESREGFDIASSGDGISWEKPQRLLTVQTANNNTQTGQTWNSYPTLWSPDRSSDRETSENLILVYSEGKFNQEPHSMRATPIKLSQLGGKSIQK